MQGRVGSGLTQPGAQHLNTRPLSNPVSFFWCLGFIGLGCGEFRDGGKFKAPSGRVQASSNKLTSPGAITAVLPGLAAIMTCC